MTLASYSDSKTRSTLIGPFEFDVRRYSVTKNLAGTHFLRATISVAALYVSICLNFAVHLFPRFEADKLYDLNQDVSGVKSIWTA